MIEKLMCTEPGRTEPNVGCLAALLSAPDRQQTFSSKFWWNVAMDAASAAWETTFPVGWNVEQHAAASAYGVEIKFEELFRSFYLWCSPFHARTNRGGSTHRTLPVASASRSSDPT